MDYTFSVSIILRFNLAGMEIPWCHHFSFHIKANYNFVARVLVLDIHRARSGSCDAICSQKAMQRSEKVVRSGWAAT